MAAQRAAVFGALAGGIFLRMVRRLLALPNRMRLNAALRPNIKHSPTRPAIPKPRMFTHRATSGWATTAVGTIRITIRIIRSSMDVLRAASGKAMFGTWAAAVRAVLGSVGSSLASLPTILAIAATGYGT